MGLNIKNERAHKLARELSQLTGESMSKAVTKAIEERLEREKRLHNRPGLIDALNHIAMQCSLLPTLDKRSPDEILGYDGRGLPR